jgi:hypothetical protein
MDHLSQPLFEGFVFVGSNSSFNEKGHPGPSLTTEVKQSQSVLGFLFTANQPRLHKELIALASHPEDAHVVANCRSGDVKRGMSVEFLPPHSFAGLRGRVAGLMSQHLRVVTVAVEMHLLGRLVEVKVAAETVRLLDY